MRFKIEVIVDYYPKNLFFGTVFSDGIFKGEICEKVCKNLKLNNENDLDWVPCSFHKTIPILLQNQA